MCISLNFLNENILYDTITYAFMFDILLLYVIYHLQYMNFSL